MIDHLNKYASEEFNLVEIGIAKALIVDELGREPRIDFSKLFKNSESEIEYLADIFDMPEELIKKAIMDLHANLTIVQFAMKFDEAMKEMGFKL